MCILEYFLKSAKSQRRQRFLISRRYTGNFMFHRRFPLPSNWTSITWAKNAVESSANFYRPSVRYGWIKSDTVRVIASFYAWSTKSRTSLAIKCFNKLSVKILVQFQVRAWHHMHDWRQIFYLATENKINFTWLFEIISCGTGLFVSVYRAYILKFLFDPIFFPRHILGHIACIHACINTCTCMYTR